MQAPAFIRVLICVCLGARLLLSAGTSSAGDPHRVWKTIETEHFVIHYYEPLLDIARQVAAAAERSHAVLVPVFAHAPEEKTQVIITDEIDGANGFASVVPRNRVQLYASAPTSLSSLNDHDDWIYGLVAHEYTHIVHLDSIGGLPRLVNKIFGKIWSPNQVQPRWVIEGIATYQESEHTSGGRTRNALFEMDLRAATLAGEQLGLDMMTNLPRGWPRGNAAYLYGSHFLKYVFDRHGADTLRQLSWTYGTSPIPYGLNRAIQRATGQTFEELYDAWGEYLRDKYAMQEEAVERAGRREGRRLTFTTETNRNPRYTRDGRHVIWLQSDGYSPGRFRIMPVGGNVGAAHDYANIERVGAFDVLSDGSMVVEQTTVYRSNYSFQDLYLWNKHTGTLQALTHGARVRDPAVSPDERQVAFMLNGNSRSRIAVMPLRPHAPYRILWEGEGRFDQAGEPAWSPDGRYIAFSAWSQGGYRDIWVVEVASGKAERLTHDRAIDVSPVFAPDGAYLYFASDRSGIYNVYALHRESRTLHQVTNVIDGVLNPYVSPDGRRLVYQGFGVGGYDLYEIDLAPARWLAPLPFVNARPDPVVIRPHDVVSSEPRPYRPLETLAPRSYSVQLAANSFGNAVSVQTSGGDVIGRHGYTLGATLGLERKDINFGGSYSYDRLWPSLRLAVARDTSRRSGLILDGTNTTFIQDTYSLTASMGLPVLSTADGWGSVSLDYDLDWLRMVENSYAGPDPNELVPGYPRTDVLVAGLALRLSYSDVAGYTYTVGGQEGQSFSTSLRVNHPSLGSASHSLVLTYRWDAFQKLPWATTSALAVRLAGGILATDQTPSGGFSLGGVPDQDIARSVIDNLRLGTSGYLRGYARGAVFGRQYHLANIEYRQELLDLERGLSTLPIYVRRLHLAGLLDVGNAFDGPLAPGDFKAGVGGSVRLDVQLGYFIPGSFDIGYARGLMSGGVGEYWLLLTGTI